MIAVVEIVSVGPSMSARVVKPRALAAAARRGLRELLQDEPDFEVLASATGAEEALLLQSARCRMSPWSTTGR
jgi:hypothetical protein